MEKIKIYYRKFLLRPKNQILIGLLILVVFNLVQYICVSVKLLKLSITPDSLISYLTVIASIAGIVGAVMLGYFFFYFQTIESKQQNWYLALKSEIDNLVTILHEMPSEFRYLMDPLNESVRALQLRKLRDYPIVGDDWIPIHKPADLAAEKDVIGYPIVYRMIISLGKIEEFAGEIGISKIAILYSAFILKTIKKLFYLLLLSAATIFYLYLVKDTFIIHSFVIGSLMLFFLYFISVAILEALLYLYDYYREIVPETNQDEISK